MREIYKVFSVRNGELWSATFISLPPELRFKYEVGEMNISRVGRFFAFANKRPAIQFSFTYPGTEVWLALTERIVPVPIRVAAPSDMAVEGRVGMMDDLWSWRDPGRVPPFDTWFLMTVPSFTVTCNDLVPVEKVWPLGE